MDLNEAMNQLGSYGKWQVRLFLVISLFQGIFTSFQLLSPVWINYTPEHHCKIPEGASINESIPRNADGKLSSCLKYVNYSISNQTMDCDIGWVYDQTDSYTVVNQWDLVCKEYKWNQISQTALIVGVMIGAATISFFSDKFGRKPVFIISTLMLSTVGVAHVFFNVFYIIVFLRFLTGVFQQGVLLAGYVYVTEIFNVREKSFAGSFIQVFWGLGVALLAVLAFLLPNWVHLQLTISLIGFLSLPLIWLMPESIYWLHANKQLGKAESVLRKAAAINKVSLPEIIFTEKTCLDNKTEETSSMLLNKKNTYCTTVEKPTTCLDFIKNRKILLYLFISSFSFLDITLVFYGLTYGAEEIEGNRFVNGFIIGLIEVPAYALTYLLIKRFGRKKPIIVQFILTGFFLILLTFIPKDPTGKSVYYYIPIVLSSIGKFCITSCFSIIFLLVVELFPTNLRNQALGIASFFGRLGNLLATFTVYLMKINPTIPTVAFVAFSFIAALLVILLPETHNKPLPQTLDEIESWTKPVHVTNSSHSKPQINGDLL